MVVLEEEFVSFIGVTLLSLFKGLIASSDNDIKEPLHKFGASIAILAGGVVQHRADVVGLRRELMGQYQPIAPIDSLS